jgi:hypothetical protein
MENHLARPAEPTIELKTLRDVVHAHEALDKGIQERSDSGAKGNMEWWPNAFVVVRQGWRSKPGGLLFVFADDENDSKMDKFFVKLEKVYLMLSNPSLQDEELAGSKEIYSRDAV